MKYLLTLLIRNSLDAPLLHTHLESLSGSDTLTSSKWRWSGDLFVNADELSAVQYGSIVISNPTESPSGELELRYTNFALKEGNSLRITKLHPISIFHLIRAACKPATQLLEVGPRGEADKERFGKLVGFMNYSHVVSALAISKKRLLTPMQIALVELFVGEISAGFLALIPTQNKPLLDAFSLSALVYNSNTLTAAVLPWKISTDRYRKVKWWGSLELSAVSLSRPLHGKEEVFLPRSSHFVSREQSLQIAQKGPVTQRMASILPAVNFLHFPRRLAETMSLPDRPFIIWDDYPLEAPHSETRALRTVLAACSSPRPAKEVQPLDHAKVIFVHIGALATLYRLPRLVERRSKHQETFFYLYGTHPNINPTQWGIREVFVLGE